MLGTRPHYFVLFVSYLCSTSLNGSQSYNVKGLLEVKFSTFERSPGRMMYIPLLLIPSTFGLNFGSRNDMHALTCWLFLTH